MKEEKKQKSPKVQNTQNNQKSKTESAVYTKKFVIISVSILVGIALIFGATLGIVAAVKNASYVMKLEGIGIDSGVANYLSSYFKAKYMQSLASSGVDVSDTASFWNTKVFGENTYGDYLEYETEQYMKQIIASLLIFDMYTSLTKEDEDEIDLAVKEILVYKASGDKKAFNEDTEKYGFDYNDFKNGTEILYKTYILNERIFGKNGANMTSFSEYCEEYFSGYARVKLIFIRTKDTFVLDSEGNRVKDDKNNDSLRELTDSEKAERQEYIARLDACMNGINDGSVAPEQFDVLAEELIAKYGENSKESITGYYFSTGSTYTEEFKKYYPTVVSKAFDMEIGDCSVIEFGSVMAEGEEEKEESTAAFVGRCYIYRVEKEKDAYKKQNDFFADFYSLASSSLHQKMIEEYAKKVEVLDKWEKIDQRNIPYNTDYVARF